MCSVVLRVLFSLMLALQPDVGWCARHKGSFLWQIETVPPSYFFGTIHVPYTRVWDAIPENVKRAFSSAQSVYFEVDLNNPSTLSALSSCQLLPSGVHVSHVLPTDLYVKVKLYLDYVRRSMPYWMSKDQKELGLQADYLFSTITANWQRKRPMWLLLMIATLTKSDIPSRGLPVLDLYLSQLATSHKKKVGGVEVVREHCHILNQINATLINYALNETLKEQENIRLGLDSRQFTTDDLIEQYRSGNMDPMIYSQDTLFFSTLSLSSGHNESSRDDEDRRLDRAWTEFLRSYMIVNRNRQMAAAVIQLLTTNPDTSFFFAFGAGHFVGEESVVDLVRSAGLPVRQVQPEEALNAHDSKRPKTGLQGSAVWSSNRSKNTVQGTFEDLSEEEKTRALLQFLQYHQQQEQLNETRKFKEMIRGNENLDNDDDDEPIQGQSKVQDEQAVENSLRIWFGFSGGSSSSGGDLLPPILPPVNLLLLLTIGHRLLTS